MKLAFFTTALVISGIMHGQLTDDEKTSMYRYAVELYNEGKYDLVIENCRNIAIKSVGDVNTYSLSAKACRALGNYDDAIREYNNAINLYQQKYGKRDPSLAFDRGMIFMCQKKFDAALADFNDARRLFRQTGKENFLYLEEIGRASHYREDNKYAIEILKQAIQNGSSGISTYIDLASSLLSYNNLSELKKLTDSLLSGEIIDSVSYYYLSAVNDIASNNIYAASLDKINSAIFHYYTSNQLCYQGFYYDQLYSRAYIYSFLGNDSAAYEDYRQIAKNNSLLNSVKLKTDELKIKLGKDVTPPDIVLRNPQVDADNRGILYANKKKQEFYGQVTDSASGIELITVSSNGRTLPPITSTEFDGIFGFNLELNPGTNKIVISATDKNENTSSKTFYIDFKERVQVQQDLDDSAFVDAPDINTSVTYFAVLIAEKDYDDEGFKDLQTPIDDATEIASILVNQYGFSENNVKLLANASRQSIIDTLSETCKMMTDADNLFIFYAGHGSEKKINNEIVGGYIIPSDAKKGNRGTYISNEDLVEPVLNTQARHILFVLDACFAGLMRSTLDDAPQGIKNLYNNKSRRILTSGNREEVPDGGMFIANVKRFLRNPGKVFVPANDLYSYIINHNQSNNTPIYERISNTSDVGIGQFIFIKRQ